MQYLAENYLHIINMKRIALEILTAKADGLQVLARIRALLGLNVLDQHCLRIAALYRAISYTAHQQEIIKLCSDAVRVLLSINPNYVGEIIDVNHELLTIHIERSRLTGFSHNVNEFFIVEVHADGTLHYVYLF